MVSKEYGSQFVPLREATQQNMTTWLRSPRKAPCRPSTKFTGIHTGDPAALETLRWCLAEGW